MPRACRLTAARLLAIIFLSTIFLPTVDIAQAQVVPHYPDRSYSSLFFRDAFWFATPRGLYKYRSDENIWSVLGKQNGLLSNSITVLAEDQDVLWIGQNNGATSFDLRSNTMLHFDSARGLPAGKVLSIAFEPDFVWIGSSHGAGRFDKLIEQWQLIDRDAGLEGDAVYLISPQQDRVFLFTDEAVNEYDPRYERWRQYRHEGDAILDAFLAGSTAWLLRENDILRFDFLSKVFHRYDLEGIGSFTDIQNIVIDGEGFWIVTEDGLWNYDAQSDSFRPFRDTAGLPDQNFRAAALSSDASQIWFSTETAVSRFNRKDRAWSYFNQAGGLPALDFSVMFTSGSEFVGISGEQIIYYRGLQNRWFTYDLLAPGDGAGDGDGAGFSLDPAEGSYVDFGSDIRLDLSGTRTSWLLKSPFDQNEPANRNDLKARLEIGGERTLSASYNDSDFEDVVYGAAYRGAASDIVNTFQVGDFRGEQGNRNLLQSFGLFGAGGRLVFGERSTRYGRSPVDVTGVTGHKTTAITTEFFSGQTREHYADIADIEYTKKQFYTLHPDAVEQPVDGNGVRIFASLPANATATNNILPVSEFAGYPGDWIELAEVRDYILEAERGLIDITGLSFNPEALAATFTSGGTSQTVLLATPDSSSHEVVNRYFLRGIDIIPTSMKLRIVNSLDIEQPLGDFGLDNNGDGRVDPEFLEYSHGILRFTDSRPFPPWVYEDSARSEYRIQARFQTFSTGYILGHSRIRRGSEQITVDGLPAKAGKDYILDYTSGYLLFTRDGVINDDSRIEITYEYIRNAVDERYSQVSATVSPSDFAQAAVTGGRFNPEGSTLDVNFGHGLAEVRWITDAFDLRIVPEFAASASDSSNGNAYGVMAAFSSGPARLTVQTRRNGDGYTEPFQRRFTMGLLNSENLVSAEYDILPELRLFGNWKQRGGKDEQNGDEAGDEFLYAGVQLTPRNLPSVTLRGERLSNYSGGWRLTRTGLRGDVTWTLSPDALQSLGIASALLTSYARLSEEEATGTETGSRQYQNYFLRAVVSPRQLFSINTYYRGDLQKQQETGAWRPAITREKLFADVVMEHVRGLSLGLRYNRDLQLLYLPVISSEWNANDRSSFQLTSRLSPGVLVDALSPITLHLNYSNAKYSYVTEGSGEQDLFLSMFTSLPGRQRWSNYSDSYEGRLEWLPASSFLYSITGCYQDYDVKQLSSSFREQRRELIQRADYRPGSRAQYSAQFSLTGGDTPWSRYTRYAPLAWMEHRLSAVALTRISINGFYEHRTQGLDEVETSDIAPAANLTLSFEEFPVLRRLEVRGDISWHYTEIRRNPAPHPTVNGTTTISSIISTLYLDIYPHPVSYIRLRFSHLLPLKSARTAGRDLTIQIVIQL